MYNNRQGTLLLKTYDVHYEKANDLGEEKVRQGEEHGEGPAEQRHQGHPRPGHIANAL